MLVARGHRVVQMKGDGAAVNKFPGTAQMVEAGADVGVLAHAPADVGFVEAVDGHEVVAPESHVAADDAALLGVAFDDGEGPADAFGDAGDLAGEHPLRDGRLAGFELGDKFLAHEAAAALDPEAAFGEAGVVLDVAAVRDAIAIGEDEVIAGGGGEGAVQDDGLAEAVIGVPDMFDGHGEFGGPFFHEGGNGFARAVIGDENLIGQAGLAAEAAKDFLQREGLVVGADDEGNFQAGGGGSEPGAWGNPDSMTLE